MLRNGAFASITLLLVLVCAFGVVGCKSQGNPPVGASPAKSIVGTWTAGDSSGLTWQFTKDGKLIMTTGEVSRSGGNSTETTGTQQSNTNAYKLNGNVLLVTPVNGEAQHGSSTTSLTIQWVSADRFQIPAGATKLTFNRQK